MKKLIPLFIVVAIFVSAISYTRESTDFKKCLTACMAKISDKKNCTYICDDSGERKEK